MIAGVEDAVYFTHAGHGSAAENVGVPFNGIPKDLAHGDFIFLHRNPLDTAVSYFFQLIHKDVKPGRKTWAHVVERGVEPPTDIDAFVLHQHYGVPLICTFNAAWFKKATQQRALILSYEGMTKDPELGFRLFFDRIGHPEVDAKDIAERSTFEKLREIQARGEGDIYRIRQAWASDPESAKVRRGKVQGYRDYLKPGTIKLAAKVCGKHGFKI